jgi:hypothetical protein
MAINFCFRVMGFIFQGFRGTRGWELGEVMGYWVLRFKGSLKLFKIVQGFKGRSKLFNCSKGRAVV